MSVDCDLQMKSAAMFGSTTITGNNAFVNMVGNCAFTATTVTGAGARSCADKCQHHVQKGGRLSVAAPARSR